MNEKQNFLDYSIKNNLVHFTENDILESKEVILNIPSVFKEKFPEFTNMIVNSTTLEIKLKNEKIYWLLCWNINDRIHEILCIPPKNINSIGSINYQVFSTLFGGILEFMTPLSNTIDENEFYWLNMVATLCQEEALEKDFILDIKNLMSMYEQNELPTEQLNLEDFFVIASEFNGNLTLCNQFTEEVIMFASDHCFDFVKEYNNYPEYTFYSISDAPNLIYWIELLAIQWTQIINQF